MPLQPTLLAGHKDGGRGALPPRPAPTAAAHKGAAAPPPDCPGALGSPPPDGPPRRDFLPLQWHPGTEGSPGPQSGTRTADPGLPRPTAAPRPHRARAAPRPGLHPTARGGLGAPHSPPPTGNIPEAFLKLGGPPQPPYPSSHSASSRAHAGPRVPPPHKARAPPEERADRGGRGAGL